LAYLADFKAAEVLAKDTWAIRAVGRKMAAGRGGYRPEVKVD
jgi:hypothetical protein